MKSAICAVRDSASISNFYHVVAFDQIAGSNVWVNTGFVCASNDHFSARIGLASSMGEGFVSAVYSFGGERDYPAVIHVGEAAARVGHIVISGAGTLSSMSAVTTTRTKKVLPFTTSTLLKTGPPPMTTPRLTSTIAVPPSPCSTVPGQTPSGTRVSNSPSC